MNSGTLTAYISTIECFEIVDERVCEISVDISTHTNRSISTYQQYVLMWVQRSLQQLEQLHFQVLIAESPHDHIHLVRVDVQGEHRVQVMLQGHQEQARNNRWECIYDAIWRNGCLNSNKWAWKRWCNSNKQKCNAIYLESRDKSCASSKVSHRDMHIQESLLLWYDVPQILAKSSVNVNIDINFTWCMIITVIWTADGLLH